jgi:cytochrome c peroxidase
MKTSVATQTLFLLASLGWLVVACGPGSGPDPEETLQPYTLAAPKHFSGNFRLPTDNPMTVQGVELGRMLFYEKKLSGDNTQACASCHQQKFAFTDGGKRFSTGIAGQVGNRNTMSLANLLWVNRFFWDGRSSSLEEQALIPIQDPIEMHQSLAQSVAKLQATDPYPARFKLVFGSERITAENLAKALAQFERTLISADSRYDRYLLGNRAALTSLELEGLNLFFTHPDPLNGLRGGNCGDCHLQVTTAGDPSNWRGFHNNGLDNDGALNEGLQKVTGNAFDRGKFRAPPLRNIALTAPYMHDGRFNSLAQVLDHYDQHIRDSQTLDPLILAASNDYPASTPVKLFLTPREKQAILAFMETLTDSTFINDRRFGNPFGQR